MRGVVCTHIQYRIDMVPTMTSRSRPDPLAGLNAEQRAAVEHGLGGADNGPLLVIAGAGTGKTMTLAARVARLVLAGADPNRVLLVTFSRRASQEMERRAGRVLHAALGFGAGYSGRSEDWEVALFDLAAFGPFSAGRELRFRFRFGFPFRFRRDVHSWRFVASAATTGREGGEVPCAVGISTRGARRRT